MKALDSLPKPPVARQHQTELTTHGDTRVDPYFWLRERDNPEVLSYLVAENDYTDKMLGPTKELQEKLIAEMRGRVKEDDSTAPYRHGEFFYYDRYEKGQEYPIYCRKQGEQGAEQVLLDVNLLAQDHDYFDVGGFEVSPDHRLAAFAADTIGRRFFDLTILNLDTGEYLEDMIPSIANNFVWAKDNKTLFYTKQHQESLRWYQVYRYQLGGHDHSLVLEESDEAFDLSLDTSLSEQFIYLESESTLTTEVRYFSASDPYEQPKLFFPREQGHEYYVTDGGDRFFVLTNHDAENFKLVEAPLLNTDMCNWQEVLPYRSDVLLEDVEVFKNHLVLAEKTQGRVRLQVLERETLKPHYIQFDDEIFTAQSGDNFEYDTAVFRFDYESMTTPDTVYDYDMGSRQKTLIQRDKVLGDFNPEYYQSKYVYATAQDGTQIPISMVYRKDSLRPQGNPTLQYGYGAYGIPMEPEFDSDLLSLLDRGFIFAVAHVRGGAELGRPWYYDGRQLKKKNSFTDFIDCSKYLLDQGYTAPGQLFASGGSAGGLLMGAVMNMAPHLYKGIYTRVPFVDVVTTMLDDSIPLTTGEYDEWGNPNEKEYYDYILSYSPYDNVEAKEYPNLLVTTGLYDSQVQYWEPAKWVAKLRAVKKDDHWLLLKTDTQAGHSGKTGRFNSLSDTALNFAFVIELAYAREG